MKKWMLLLLSMVTITLSAQEAVTATAESAPAPKFGYLSYDAVLQSMPEYAQLQVDMAQLRDKYEAEQKRVETDFNKKYEEFLDGQSSYPKTILQKRQSELQEMLDKNIAFKKESQQLLQKAEADGLQVLKARVAEAMMKVGTARNLPFIINTDINGVAWYNVNQGEDVTEAVKAMLNNAQQ
jgi:outer membrane protein